MVDAIRKIEYGPHVLVRNQKMEEAIHFLENPENNSKRLPRHLFLEHEKRWISQHGRLAFAELLRRSLQGGVGG